MMNDLASGIIEFALAIRLAETLETAWQKDMNFTQAKFYIIEVLDVPPEQAEGLIEMYEKHVTRCFRRGI